MHNLALIYGQLMAIYQVLEQPNAFYRNFISLAGIFVALNDNSLFGNLTNSANWNGTNIRAASINSN